MSRPIAAAIRSTRSGSKVAAPGDRRRVDRGAVGGEAGQALLVDQRRDAEPGGLEHDALLPHQLGRALGRGRPARCRRPGSGGRARGALASSSGTVPGRGEDVLHRRDVERPPRSRSADSWRPGRALIRPRPVSSCMSLPTQRLPSWATFSSSVISASSASTRSSTDRPGSCHRRRRAGGSGGARTGRIRRRHRRSPMRADRQSDRKVSKCLHAAAVVDVRACAAVTVDTASRWS